MEIITGVCDFVPTANGIPSYLFIYRFPRKVRSVGACLTGFDAEFPDADHDFGELIVGLEPLFFGYAHDEILYLFVDLRLADQDGGDLFSGQVRYRLFVEFGPLVPPVLDPRN